MKAFSLNNKELLDFQPNRPPFLMIDHVTKVKPGEYAEGYKNLPEDEWFFPIHFPGNPNMPGALQLEALAQMLTVAITTLPGNKGMVTHAISHEVNFKKEVKPGDRMDINTKVISWKRGICIGYAVCKVKDDEVSNAEMKITIPEIFTKYLPK